VLQKLCDNEGRRGIAAVPIDGPRIVNTDAYKSHYVLVFQRRQSLSFFQELGRIEFSRSESFDGDNFCAV
jgi:hypothetical protein